MKLIKVESSQGSLGKNLGSEKAPEAIINELENIYTNEWGYETHFQTDKVEVVEGNLEETHNRIYEKAKNLEKSVFIGGDHSITYSTFKAFSEKGNCGLVVFDAHLDLMSGTNIASHEDYLRKLIEEGFLDANKVILIGIRNGDVQEYQYMKQKGIKYYSMREISFEGIQEVCDGIMETARGWQHLYISIDIDVLDAAFTPGTGYPVPGGLTSRELLYLLQRLKKGT